jgi:hypothetical protein
MMHTAAMPKLLLRKTALMYRLFVPQLLSHALGQMQSNLSCRGVLCTAQF